MPLIRPQVVGPLSELSQTIRVSGAVGGAVVTLVSISVTPPRLLFKGPLAGFNDRLTLPGAVKLHAGDLLVAMQERGADKSPDPVAGMMLAVPVQKAPGAVADLGQANLVTIPWECGRHTWINGGTPGTTAKVLFGTAAGGEGEFLDAQGARFTLAIPVPASVTVSVLASAPSVGDGASQNTLSRALPGHPGDALPGIVPDPRPSACESSLFVTGVYDGAEVIVTRSDGHVQTEVSFGFDAPALWIPLDPSLGSGEELLLRQQVDNRCKRSSVELLFPVQPAPGAARPRLGPLCVGDPLVHVENLIPGAPVQIFVNGQTFDGTAPKDGTVGDFPIDPPVPAGNVAVQQSQCGVWGPQDTGTAHLSLGVAPAPKIIGPLYECIVDIPVADVPLGAVVQVFSEKEGRSVDLSPARRTRWRFTSPRRSSRPITFS